MHLGLYLRGCHMHRAAATAVLRLLWTRKQQSNSDQSLTRLVSVCIYAMAVYNTEEALDVILGEDFDSGDESEIEEDLSFPLPRLSDQESDSDLESDDEAPSRKGEGKRKRKRKGKRKRKRGRKREREREGRRQYIKKQKW